MRSLPRALLAGGLGFAVALVVAACGGGSGLLSADQASTINNQLSQISTALSSGDCRTVSSATVNLSNAVAHLPATLNPKLRGDLDDGVSRVGQLANQNCRQAAPAAPRTSSTSSASTTTPSSTSTPSTSTSPSSSTSTSTSTTTTATTPSTPGTTTTGSGGAGLGGGGSGNGNGNGNGNSGGASTGKGNG